MKKIITLTLIAALLISSTAIARRTKDITREIDAEGAKRIVVEADLGAGEFNITPRDMDQAAMVEISYNPRNIENDISYDLKRGTGYLYLESSTRRSYDIDTDDNVWDIQLSTRYTTSLDIEIGACEAEIDLGGIPLEELSIEIGAASGVIDFSERNPIRMTSLDIEAGASSLEMENVGNANFESFSFEGGVGAFVLDLRGEYEGESEIDIEIGLGSAEIYVPKDVAIRIDAGDGNWLSTVDIHARNLDEVEDGIYESDDFDRAKTRIILIIEVGLGSVDIYRR